MRRTLLTLVAAAVLQLSAVSLVLADYALQSGDKVELSIVGLPEYTITSVVDGDGVLSLGWLGQIEARGRTVHDLTIQARTRGNGEILRRYNRDGQVYTITLEGARIDVQRLGYLPVIMGGDVAMPGEVAFTPGMTVREAVAHAGGAEDPRDNIPELIDPVNVIEWRSEFQQASVAQVEAQLRLWRIGAALDRAWDKAIPDFEGGLSVPDSTFETLSLEQEALLLATQREFEREEAYYVAADVQANRRIELLTQQRSEQAMANDFDRQEVERTRDLVERSLAPSSRLADVRRATALSTTQLLDIEEALSAAELARLRLEREYEQAVEQRVLALLAERRQADADLRAATNRLEVLAQFLGVSGSENLALAMPASDYRAILVRKTAEGPISRPVSNDEALIPGDFIEIELLQVPPDLSQI